MISPNTKQKSNKSEKCGLMFFITTNLTYNYLICSLYNAKLHARLPFSLGIKSDSKFPCFDCFLECNLDDWCDSNEQREHFYALHIRYFVNEWWNYISILLQLIAAFARSLPHSRWIFASLIQFLLLRYIQGSFNYKHFSCISGSIDKSQSILINKNWLSECIYAFYYLNSF